ncbi:hypothetical protein ACUN24_09100 [Pedobacter sp. WC2501]|uniref:hypothetical protein n=1 Tax=Pedobacter sp. WC2501 TaxID=3461400 RepID=UPI0040462D37
MNISPEKWKIFQTEELEYILLSSGFNSQKIKGNNAPGIVEILSEIQSNHSFQEAKLKLKTKYDDEFIENVLEWLEYNKFIDNIRTKEIVYINIIGEFSDQEESIIDFINNLPDGIEVNHYVNLSETKNITIKEGQTTLLIAPFWHNQETIIAISELMMESEDDFFYVELYNNGLALGPLLNSSKGTACLNCIEKRKIFNSSNPALILENIINKGIKNENLVNVLQIGHSKTNNVLIYNELEKILLKQNKSAYNKSIFIDLDKYENSQFRIIKAPNCEVCNPKIIYNPL